MSGDNGLALRVPAGSRPVEEALARLIRAREATHEALSALRRAATVAGTARALYRAHPGIFLGAAFLVGFLLARRR